MIRKVDNKKFDLGSLSDLLGTELPQVFEKVSRTIDEKIAEAKAAISACPNNLPDITDAELNIRYKQINQEIIRRRGEAKESSPARLDDLPVTLEQYQEGVNWTAKFPESIPQAVYCTLGASGEMGEVSEKIKKLFRDKGGVVTPEFREAIEKEIGDVLYYLTALSGILGIRMSDVARTNQRKLVSRLVRDKIHGDGDDR